MIVLVTCKNEDDLIKTEGTRVFTTLHIDFSDANSVVKCWNLAEIRTNPSVYACPCYLQKLRRSNQKRRRWSAHNMSPIINLWGFPEVQGKQTHPRFYGCPRFLQD